MKLIKRLTLTLAVVLLLASPSFGATYYACIAGDIDVADAWEDAAGCDGSTFTITGAFPASGDVLESNNLAMVINVDPGPNGIVTLQNTAGDGFSTVTSVSPITITANGTTIDDTVPILTISGTADANPALTIAGNTTWTGGDSSQDYAISDGHTVGYVVLGSAGNPVAIQGGSNSTAYGYYVSANAPITGWANSTAGTSASGFYVNSATTLISLTGNCTGSSGSNSAMGCYVSHSGGHLVLTGNIVNTARSFGAGGPIRYTPIAPSSGVTGNFIKFDGGGTAIYLGDNTDDVTKALTTFYYIDKTDGGSDVGTASAGSSGAGAWGW